MKILKTLLLTGSILLAFLLVGLAQEQDKTPRKPKPPIIKIPVNKPVEGANRDNNSNKPNI